MERIIKSKTFGGDLNAQAGFQHYFCLFHPALQNVLTGRKPEFAFKMMGHKRRRSASHRGEVVCGDFSM